MNRKRSPWRDTGDTILAGTGLAVTIVSAIAVFQLDTLWHRVIAAFLVVVGSLLYEVNRE